MSTQRNVVFANLARMSTAVACAIRLLFTVQDSCSGTRDRETEGRETVESIETAANVPQYPGYFGMIFLLRHAHPR